MGAQAVRDLANAKIVANTLCAAIPTVVVTAGGDGVAWSVRGQHADAIPARQVALVSTHGADNMFIGTLYHAIAQKFDLQTAIETAARHLSEV